MSICRYDAVVPYESLAQVSHMELYVCRDVWPGARMLGPQE